MPYIFLISLYLYMCHIFSSFHNTSRCAIYFPRFIIPLDVPYIFQPAQPVALFINLKLKILGAVLFIMRNTIMLMIMTMTATTIISPSSAVRQLPPCLFCSFALGPSWPARRVKYFYINCTIYLYICVIYFHSVYIISLCYMYFLFRP